MADYIYAYLISLGSIAVLDATWLGVISPKFYKKYVGFIMAKSPNWLAAVAFYLIYILGLIIFVVHPGWTQHQAIMKIILLGGLYGLVTYSTYDLTNQATLKNWPFIVTITDIVWGSLLTSGVSIVAVEILKNWVK